MSDGGEEKSRGLKFAEQQLLRHGWKQGRGLGRAEDGISEAIRVKVKAGRGGVGHTEGEQFSFHWWDHVFNKASSSLQVETSQNGTRLRKRRDEEEEEEKGRMISNKKPGKAALDKSKLYGCFVKSATLLSGQEHPEQQQRDSESSSSDEETLDLSSSSRLSDWDLRRVCGGRTAHKGARHGVTMSAKLARLERQEAEFMARYGGKSQSESCAAACSSQEEQEEQQEEQEEQQQEETTPVSGLCVSSSALPADGQLKKKKKKKKRKRRRDEEQQELQVVDDGEENKETGEDLEERKRRRRKVRRGEEEEERRGEEEEERRGEEEEERRGEEEEGKQMTVKTKRKKCKKGKTDETQKKSRD